MQRSQLTSGFELANISPTNLRSCLRRRLPTWRDLSAVAAKRVGGMRDGGPTARDELGLASHATRHSFCNVPRPTLLIVPQDSAGQAIDTTFLLDGSMFTI